jgi:hypothetical protein
MRRRSGSTSRRPNLDVLENRHLLSSVIPGNFAPTSPPPIMVFVGRGAFTAPAPDPGWGLRVSNGISPAHSSWNPAGFGGGPGSWGGWGGPPHHDFRVSPPGVDTSAPMGPMPFSSSVAAPTGPLDSAGGSTDPGPGSPGGSMMGMPTPGGGPFTVSYGDPFGRRGSDDPLPFMRGRDFPRAPFLPGSMLGLQLAQDQALRGVVSNPEAVTAALSPVTTTTTEAVARTNSPALQSSPDFGRQNPLGLSLIVDEEAMNRVLSLDYIVVPGRVAVSLALVAGETSLDESSAANQAATNAGEPDEALPPHAAGLMASALPHDQRSLEEAVDQFLDQLHELNVGSLIEPDPIRALVVSAALISAGVIVETARRRLSPRRRRNQSTRVWDANESEELLGFPELPGSWSARWI